MPKTPDEQLIYCFTDIETTGADEAVDNILEVGVVLTDANLDVLHEQSWVLFDEGNKLATAPEIVQEMHKVNGLAALLPFGEALLPFGEALRDVESQWMSTISLFGAEQDFVLAGSGVSHFDRRFLTWHMPHLIRWFRYYNIDVGVLRRTMRLIGREDLLMEACNDKTHRALEDARLHLEEVRHLNGVLAL